MCYLPAVSLVFGELATILMALRVSGVLEGLSWAGITEASLQHEWRKHRSFPGPKSSLCEATGGGKSLVGLRNQKRPVGQRGEGDMGGRLEMRPEYQ